MREMRRNQLGAKANLEVVQLRSRCEDFVLIFLSVACAALNLSTKYLLPRRFVEEPIPSVRLKNCTKSSCS